MLLNGCIYEIVENGENSVNQLWNKSLLCTCPKRVCEIVRDSSRYQISIAAIYLTSMRENVPNLTVKFLLIADISWFCKLPYNQGSVVKNISGLMNSAIDF